MLTVSSSIMKYLLFIFNLVFVLTGISLITIGLIIRSDFGEYHGVAKEEYISASHLLIFTGVFIFIVSFFGCCGAIRENQLMLFTFSVIMAAIFAVEMVIGVTGYMMKGKVTDALTDSLTQSMANYSKSDDVTKMWDSMQEQLNCCGAKNYTDWKNYTGMELPISCCSSTQETVKVCNSNSTTLHKTPCIDQVGSIFMNWLSVIGFTGIFIGIIQITGICLILVGWSINYIYFEYSEFLEVHFFSPGVFMILIGFLIFTIAFFGCYGAYKESTCMVTLFSVMLGVVFVLEVSAGISAYVLQADIHQLLEHTISEVLKDSPRNNNSARIMDVMQTELHCCGVHSFKDWEDIYSETNDSITLPESCCAMFNHAQPDNCMQVYKAGCLPQLETFIRESIVLLVGTASTIALIQLIGVSFSCSLAKMIRMQKTERDRQRWEMREQLISNYTKGKGEKGPVLYMTLTDIRPKT